VPVFVMNSIYWRCTMFTSTLMIMLRTMKKQKVYSLINITGLALGMSCSLLVMLFVLHELSYDRFHENADRIFRIIDVHRQSTRTPAILPKILLEECPEVEHASKIVDFSNTLVTSGEKSFIEAIEYMPVRS
jgi:putative ABC transport system permease protein